MCKGLLIKGDVSEFEDDIQAKCVKVTYLREISPNLKMTYKLNV